MEKSTMERLHKILKGDRYYGDNQENWNKRKN